MDIRKLALAAVLCGTFAGVREADAAVAPWLDPAAAPDVRVDALLPHLSMVQKLAFLHGAADPHGFAAYVPGIPALGVPPLTLDDGPAGLRDGFSSALPAPLALAATWNASAATAYGDVLGRDARAKGADVLLGPTVNIARVPVDGRNFEAFGEDPYLAAQVVAPEIEAIQAHHVIATVKHYALNNQQTGQHRDSFDVDPRTFHEIYEPAFAAAVQGARGGAVMCAYNQIDGVWACENKLMLGLLENRLGFGGFVLSDFYAQHDIYKSIFNGLDLEMPKGIIYGAPLTAAVASGNVRPATIDQHMRRILGSMVRTGLFDDPPAAGTLPAQSDLAVARSIAGESAVLLKNDAGVLPLDRSRLRSVAIVGSGAAPAPVFGGGSALVRSADATSPLAALRDALGDGVTVRYAYAQGVPFLDDTPTVDSLALTPPLPARGNGLRGEYFANANLAGAPTLARTDDRIDFDWGTEPPTPALPYASSVRWTGSLRVPVDGSYALGMEGRCACRLRVGTTVLLDAWNRSFAAPPVPLASIRLEKGTRYPIEIDWRPGGDDFVRLEWRPPVNAPNLDIERAVAAAKASDAAVVFVGDYETEGRDRTTLELQGRQNDLIAAVAAVNSRTIVVLNTGSAVLLPWLTHVAAVVEMWYPGEAAGLATADILTGAVDPAGKLPLTFPATNEAVPAAPLYPAEPGEGPARQIVYAEKLDVGYRWYDDRNVAPAFPFGFGLSYTTFALRNLRIASKGAGAARAVSVDADVANNGAVSGTAVVQLYVGYPDSAGEPPRQLRGIARVPLAAGTAASAHFTLHDDAFTIWDSARERVVPGTYKIMVGSSSRDLPLAGTIDL